MLSWVFSKLSGLYTLFRFRSVTPELRFFYKATILCQLIQVKYFWRDYVRRKPYKEIDFKGEFGAELMFALPFAYWHYKNGTLKNTVSSRYTNQMYFFSPQHEEKHLVRSDAGNFNYEMPRVLYSQDYNMEKWEPVPLKEHFRNSVYVFDKPILIVANRYNSEWDGPPVSYFGIELLDFIFSELKKQYTIIYNRPRPDNITVDHSITYDLSEYDWMKREHPDVVLMEDLYRENKAQAGNYNHFQFLVYANADKFISIHGGTATLASYFGGTNLILSKKGPEHFFGCFDKLFPQLSGATILHARTDEEVKKYVLSHYLSPKGVTAHENRLENLVPN